MKKIIVFALSILLVTSAFAQDDSKMDFGFRVGANFSTFGKLPNEVKTDGLLLGYTGGIFARFKTGSTGLYFQPEINLMSSGGKVKADLLGVNSESRTILTSLEVPFLVGLRLGTKGFGIHLHAGPAVSAILNAKAKSTIGSVESDSDITDDTNPLQMGLQFGAGVDLGPVLLGLRVNTGLTEPFKNSLNTALYEDSKVTFVQLSIAAKLF